MIFGCQVEGEGDHHGKHGTDVVIHPPAGVDMVPLNNPVLDYLSGEINPENLANECTAHTKTGPGQIILADVFPVHTAGEQNIRKDNSGNVCQGKGQAAGGVLCVELTAQPVQQVGACQHQHTAEKLVLPAEKLLSVPNNPINYSGGGKCSDAQQIDAAVLRLKYRAFVPSRVVPYGWGDIAADKNRHQREQAVPQNAHINDGQHKQRVYHQLQSKHIGKHRQEHDKHNIAWGGKEAVNTVLPAPAGGYCVFERHSIHLVRWR